MSKRVTRSMNANGHEDNRVEGMTSTPTRSRSGPSRPLIQPTQPEVNIAEEMARCVRTALPGMLEQIQTATLKMVEDRLKHNRPSKNETYEIKESTNNESLNHEESNGEAHSDNKEVKKPVNKESEAEAEIAQDIPTFGEAVIAEEVDAIPKDDDLTITSTPVAGDNDDDDDDEPDLPDSGSNLDGDDDDDDEDDFTIQYQ
ncbi:histone H2A.Z-specific chaperone CHZ1-like [Cynara cardunculus var. scolymus]|uniref:histone H2A.Z-specific chaperone CHZ1-like n=1 Tax=Cynara cardunculus var. scolymus TaxID=59895 RepID=UPI000D630CF4|nr:histone H2A.Z-specific chaperone CHZ1-like [Cynara cardunculus var. scolymus]